MLSTTIRTHSGIILSILCVGVNGAYHWQDDAGHVLDIAGDWYAAERATIHGATCHLLATAGIEVLEDTDDLLHAAMVLDSASV